MTKEERKALIKAGREDGEKYQSRAATKQKKVCFNFNFIVHSKDQDINATHLTYVDWWIKQSAKGTQEGDAFSCQEIKDRKITPSEKAQGQDSWQTVSWSQSMEMIHIWKASTFTILPFQKANSVILLFILQILVPKRRHNVI